MLSNSSSQVRKEGKTKPWQEEEKEERKNRAKQRASRTANTRDKKKRPLAKVVEGKEKERGSWREVETEAISPEGCRQRWGARFLRRALLQFCAMQVRRWVQHSSHRVSPLSLPTYSSSVKLELLSRSQVDFQVDSERSKGSRRRCRRRTIRVHVNGATLLLLLLLLLPLAPRKVGGFVCKHGPWRVELQIARSVMRRWECW